MRRALHVLLVCAVAATVLGPVPAVAASGGQDAAPSIESTPSSVTQPCQPATSTAAERTPAAHSATAATPSAAANDTVTVRSALGYGLADLDEASEIAAAADRGDLQAGRVAVRDVLVVTLRNDALATDLGAGNATAAFRDRTDGSTRPLVVRQRGTCRPPKHLVLSPNVTRVVAAPDAGVVHVVVDLANATTRNEYESEPAPESFAFPGRILVNATVDAGDGPRSVEREVEAFRREAELADVPDGEPALRTASPDAELAVDTNVDGSVPVSFVLRNDGGDVVVRSDATTDEDGAALTQVDLTGVAAGTTLNLSVRVDGHDLLDEPRTVRVVERRATVANVTAADRAQSASVSATVSLEAGGFVVLHRGDVDGPVVGHSRDLAPGDREHVTVYLTEPVRNETTVVAVAHRDANRNRLFDDANDDPRYAEGTVTGSVVVANASLPAPSNDTAPERDTSAWTATTPETTDAVATTTSSSGSVDPTTSTGGGTAGTSTDERDDQNRSIPGFDAGVAVLAVLATGLALARR
ncbi:DUF7282 domain-containing protein [Halorubellus salinus]|uniref:DUF7282 domain-containing protein n=1 Tax=Halorubellus salinus TaxID=755309 RepID=UPI001D06B64A|nr:hypothetical protein [Halorubellus salinus]